MEHELQPSGLEIPVQNGEDYKKVLARLHDVLRPKNYLEIGSNTGSSLALASCASIAIDPDFKLKENFLGRKPFCALYKMGSDDFFASYNPKQIFGTDIDFAFLDGMHLAEFLLRDFTNVERHCRNNSVIAIHDCIPCDTAMARRQAEAPDSEKSSRYPRWWTGDVWKFIKLLIQFRPDLYVVAVDAAPTGLILISRLDPQSTLLKDGYYDFLAVLNKTPNDALADYVKSLDIISTNDFTLREDIFKHFWL